MAATRTGRIKTRLTSELGLAHPILLAPMAGTSDGRLSAAVSVHGGLGILGAGFKNTAWLTKEFKLAQEEISRELGCSLPDAAKRLGIGLVTFFLPRTPGVFEAALELNPGLIWLSFGDNSDLVKRIREKEKEAKTRIRIAVQVQTVAEAVVAGRQGVDIIVAQGTEAGGHGQTASTTFCLVPQIATALADLVSGHGQKILVVAAGGVVDGRGLVSALSLGADGVVMGTRFYVTKESPEPPENKQAIVQAREGADTIRTRTWDILSGGFWPKPYNGRALRNRNSDSFAGREATLEEDLEKDPARWKKVSGEYEQHRKDKDFSHVALWAGAGVGLISGVKSAQEILEDTTAQALQVIQLLDTFRSRL